jgi:hypothetical protein
LLAVLMDFCSGSPMQFLSGVDIAMAGLARLVDVDVDQLILLRMGVAWPPGLYVISRSGVHVNGRK